MIIKKPFRRVLGVVLCCMAGAFISGCSHQEDYQRAPVHMVPATMDSTLIYYLPCDDGLHVRRCEMKTAGRINARTTRFFQMGYLLTMWWWSMALPMLIFQPNLLC